MYTIKLDKRKEGAFLCQKEITTIITAKKTITTMKKIIKTIKTEITTMKTIAITLFLFFIFGKIFLILLI